MFERFIESLKNDKKIQLILGVIMILYVSCYSDLLPLNIKQILKVPIVKMLTLAFILYLSKNNFEASMMLVLTYFVSISCIGSAESFINKLKVNKENKN